MFIIEPIREENITRELAIVFKMIEKQFGFLPPHFQLFASMDIEAMKSFIDYNLKMMKHEKIQKEVLPFLRLYIATKECRSYCTNFNSQILLKMGVSKDVIKNISSSISQIPIEQEQKVLLAKVIDAIERPQSFSKEDLNTLYENGFTDKDFFDLLSYASDFTAKSKMIEVFLEQNLSSST
jgi:alkylhydroperoxidase family enzyme